MGAERMGDGDSQKAARLEAELLALLRPWKGETGGGRVKRGKKDCLRALSDVRSSPACSSLPLTEPFHRPALTVTRLVALSAHEAQRHLAQLPLRRQKLLQDLIRKQLRGVWG